MQRTTTLILVACLLFVGIASGVPAVAAQTDSTASDNSTSADDDGSGITIDVDSDDGDSVDSADGDDPVWEDSDRRRDVGAKMTLLHYEHLGDGQFRVWLRMNTISTVSISDASGSNSCGDNTACVYNIKRKTLTSGVHVMTMQATEHERRYGLTIASGSQGVKINHDNTRDFIPGSSTYDDSVISWGVGVFGTALVLLGGIRRYKTSLNTGKERVR